MDRLQPRCDVGFCDFRSVGLQQMRLGGFDVRDRRRQALPQTQQVVNAVGGELPVLTDGREERQVRNICRDVQYTSPFGFLAGAMKKMSTLRRPLSLAAHQEQLDKEVGAYRNSIYYIWCCDGEQRSPADW